MKKYTSVLISIPEDFIPTLENFDNAIFLDPRFRKENNSDVKNDKTIRSFAIRRLIVAYLNKNTKLYENEKEETNTNEG